MTDPVTAAVSLVRAGLFDTYMVYERAGTWTVAGGREATVTLDGSHVRLRHQDVAFSRPWESRPLASIGEALAELPVPEWTAYGWLTFELAHLLTGRRDLAGTDEFGHLVVPSVEVRIDRTGATVTCGDPLLRERVHEVLAAAEPELPVPRPRTIEITHAGEWYRQAVAGDLDLAGTYVLGRAADTPARSFLLDIGGRRATGFCPETILEAGADGTVSTQPLASTRALAYDELSQVCAPGTVAVPDLMTVKPRGGVQHLGSRVSGRLAANRSAWDALQAVYPAVTASGIPKDAACEYIANTEPTPRGLYAGAVLTAGHDGALDAGLVLRTVFEEHGTRWLCAGAGIVGASRPAREYEETCEKLRSVSQYLVER